MLNPRKAAVSVLVKIEKDNAYSNLTLKDYLKDAELSAENTAFLSALVYGVLDRRITLDYVLSKFMKTPIKKTAPFTLNVLRTALYQIMYMDKIPESAAVNEAVKIIKKSKESRNAGFVNAVLRAALREKVELPDGSDAISLSIRYSAPVWLAESFINDYGADTAEALLKESLKPAPTVLRVNTTKTDAEELKEMLRNNGISVNSGEEENSLILEKGMDIAKNPCFLEGLFHVEDLASQKALSVLAPKPMERVLDICAAPGGKTFTMAEMMENRGEIVACDLYEHRTALIKAGAERLGLSIVKSKVADATVFDQSIGKFDCILCDVPCSGLGVIRRKPDIKYKPESDFEELAEIQYKILTNAVKYLKKGGRILYSTCTLRSAENENLVIRFQKEYNTFRKIAEKTLMPLTDGTDGFYYACFVSEEH